MKLLYMLILMCAIVAATADATETKDLVVNKKSERFLVLNLFSTKSFTTLTTATVTAITTCYLSGVGTTACAGRRRRRQTDLNGFEELPLLALDGSQDIQAPIRRTDRSNQSWKSVSYFTLTITSTVYTGPEITASLLCTAAGDASLLGSCVG